MKKLVILLVLLANFEIANAGPYKGVEVSTSRDRVVYYDSLAKKIIVVQQSANKLLELDVPKRVFSCFSHENKIVGISYDGILYLHINEKLTKTVKIEGITGVFSYCESDVNGFFYLLLKRGEVFEVVKYGLTDDGIDEFGTTIAHKGAGSLVLRNNQIWLLGKDFADKIN